MEFVVGILTILSFFLSIKWFRADKVDIEPKVVLMGSILSIISYFSAFILPDLFSRSYEIQSVNNRMLHEISMKYDNENLSKKRWDATGIYHSNLASLRRVETNIYFIIENIEDFEGKKSAILNSTKFIYPNVFVNNVENEIFRELVDECALLDYDDKAQALKDIYSEIVNFVTKEHNDVSGIDNLLLKYVAYIYVCYLMNELDSKHVNVNESVISSFKNIGLNIEK